MAVTLAHVLGSDALVWDNHSCMPLRPDDTSFLEQLERVHQAGVDVITLNVGFGEQGVGPHLRMLTSMRSWLDARGDRYSVVTAVDDIDRAKAAKRLAVCFDIEGMNALGGQVDLVRIYYDLGVRWMLVAYNLPNAAGGGCMASDDGLTAYGRRVIAAMNDCGMVPCGTHTGYRSARELIDFSASPVIFSHSNPRAVWDHPRNIPDDLMRACAARGGVIGINGIGIFLGPNDASVATYVRHVEYALDLVGDDHVGIALDYVYDQAELNAYLAANPVMFPSSAGFGPAMAMIAPWQLPEIAAVLVRRGHSTATLSKLFGGNHRRIAETVWPGRRPSER